MDTRIKSDIFGGEWPAIQAQEAELRKKKAQKEAEKEKKRRAQQAAAKAAANKTAAAATTSPTGVSPPLKQGPRQDNKKDKDRNKGEGGVP